MSLVVPFLNQSPVWDYWRHYPCRLTPPPAGKTRNTVTRVHFGNCCGFCQIQQLGHHLYTRKHLTKKKKRKKITTVVGNGCPNICSELSPKVTRKFGSELSHSMVKHAGFVLERVSASIMLSLVKVCRCPIFNSNLRQSFAIL